jgi:hypothetical protein
MTEFEREIVFRAMDGDLRNLKTLAYLHKHFPKYLKILNWLIQHGFTGLKLYELIQQQNGIPWRLGAFVTNKIEKEQRQLIAGRDIV